MCIPDAEPPVRRAPLLAVIPKETSDWLWGQRKVFTFDDLFKHVAWATMIHPDLSCNSHDAISRQWVSMSPYQEILSDTRTDFPSPTRWYRLWAGRFAICVRGQLGNPGDFSLPNAGGTDLVNVCFTPKNEPLAKRLFGRPRGRAVTHGIWADRGKPPPKCQKQAVRSVFAATTSNKGAWHRISVGEMSWFWQWILLLPKQLAKVGGGDSIWPIRRNTGRGSICHFVRNECAGFGPGICRFRFGHCAIGHPRAGWAREHVGSKAL